MNLTVAKAPKATIYTDCIYVHKKHRAGLARTSICRLEVGESDKSDTRSKLVWVLGNDNESSILMDLQTRLDLRVELNENYNFTLKPTCWITKLWWLSQASNPIVRTNAYVSLWALFASALSLVLAVMALCRF
jgi:hypothetical protein